MDQYLSFDWHHPLQHKCSVVQMLLRRAESHITKEEDKKAERVHIKGALQANKYPH